MAQSVTAGERPYENPRRNNTFMALEEDEAAKKCHWNALEIKGTIRNLSPQLWTFTHLNALYLNDNLLNRISSDITRLRCLTILDLSGNKLRSLPSELGDMIQLKELLLTNNMLRVLPYELGRLYQLQTLDIAGNPLPPDILGMADEPHGTTKLLTFLLDNLTVCPHPPEREWIQLSPVQRVRQSTNFTVMSYNILCEKYATRSVYGYCPSWALNWDYRRRHLLKEMLDNMADILALQEVETNQFYTFLLPELRRAGYDGIFHAKSRAKTMAESERRYVDGCAIFYNTNKFSLTEQYLIEFNQLAMKRAEGSEAMLNRVMTRDNIGLAALLEFKDASLANQPNLPKHVLVVNAHIHWDPEYCDVKLIQTIMLISELSSIVSRVQSEMGIGVKTRLASLPGVPILICSDLNSLPDSGVVEYLLRRRISTDHPDFLDFAYDSFFETTNRMSFTDRSPTGLPELRHLFNIQNTYSAEHMEYSNYTHQFKGVIDYIFYSGDFFRPVGLMGGVSSDWLKLYKVIGCPNAHFPSDHFPLLAEYELIPAQ